MLDGIKPSYFYPFINHFHPSKKAEKLASWLGGSLLSPSPYSSRARR